MLENTFVKISIWGIPEYALWITKDLKNNPHIKRVYKKKDNKYNYTITAHFITELDESKKNEILEYTKQYINKYCLEELNRSIKYTKKALKNKIKDLELKNKVLKKAWDNISK